MLRGWLKSLERKTRGDYVEVAQRDGGVVRLPSGTFWQQLFLDEIAAAKGERPRSAVHEALVNATPEAEAKIKAMIRDEGGIFLASTTERGFGCVEDAFEDLSEPNPASRMASNTLEEGS